MVGVPGKYKGCETCRRRRVKCTNERPFCQKCITSGRQCEGYERERIFITGTPETKGRVASHPKKSNSSKKSSPRTDDEDAESMQLTPMLPYTSAWEDFISLSSKGIEYSLLITALQTRIDEISKSVAEDSTGFNINFPPYVPLELQPSMTGVNFDANAQCFAQLSGVDEGDDSTESYCVFLFEQNYSTVPNMGGSTWQLAAEQMSVVRRLGPGHFSYFPNHHYFVRVYRPLAVSFALLSRRDTFLSSPEWTTTPWDLHPKSLLDQLFDIILFLPSIFSQADQLLPLAPTVERRTRAQELLLTCLNLETQFTQWLQQASISQPGQSESPHALPYWIEEALSPHAEIPFANKFTFRDGLTGLMFLHYWMSQLLFHRCIDTLNQAMFQPVIDDFASAVWPTLQPVLQQLDPSRYQHGREFAANICRGLDSALNGTVQPDMLLAPMTVALDLYREINATSQDGLLEIMWIDAFRDRLMAKGQHVGNVVQEQKWIDVANF